MSDKKRLSEEIRYTGGDGMVHRLWADRARALEEQAEGLHKAMLAAVEQSHKHLAERDAATARATEWEKIAQQHSANVDGYRARAEKAEAELAEAGAKFRLERERGAGLASELQSFNRELCANLARVRAECRNVEDDSLGGLPSRIAAIIDGEES